MHVPSTRLTAMLPSPPAYVSPVHRVTRVRVRSKRARTRPDFVVLYALAAISGMATGLFMSLLA